MIKFLLGSALLVSGLSFGDVDLGRPNQVSTNNNGTTVYSYTGYPYSENGIRLEDSVLYRIVDERSRPIRGYVDTIEARVDCNGRKDKKVRLYLNEEELDLEVCKGPSLSLRARLGFRLRAGDSLQIKAKETNNVTLRYIAID